MNHSLVDLEPATLIVEIDSNTFAINVSFSIAKYLLRHKEGLFLLSLSYYLICSIFCLASWFDNSFGNLRFNMFLR